MEANKQFRYVEYFVTIVLLFGCSVSGDIAAPTLPSVDSLPVDTTSPEVTSTLSLTMSSSVAYTIPVCSGLGKHVLASGETGISGMIIYQNDDETGLYASGGTPLRTSELLADETRRNLVFGFSPDGGWLGYSPLSTGNGTKFEDFRVILLATDGTKIENVLTTGEFKNELQTGHQLVGISGDSYWVNQELIYVTLYSQNPDTSTSGALANLPKVMNPFDGKWNDQLLELPDRFSSGIVGISPDKSRALYEGKGLSLWDYVHRTRIWHDESRLSPFRALIGWNPDSSLVAYANLYDASDNQPVLLITREGGLKPLVEKTFPVPGLTVLNISWSPNGQYLALAGREGENLDLLVYDVPSGKYINKCPIAKTGDVWPPLIWSPDSSQIAISQTHAPIVVFTISTGSILELHQHGRVRGWSDKFAVGVPKQ